MTMTKDEARENGILAVMKGRPYFMSSDYGTEQIPAGAHYRCGG